MLIVDDSYSMRTLIKKILKDADIEVVGEAKDGEEAIQLAQELRPTIITMDINMPKLSGIDATTQISKLLPHIQIVGVTGVRSPDIQQELIMAGAITIVRKPFQPAFLLGLPVFSEKPLVEAQPESSADQPISTIITTDDLEEDLLGTSEEIFVVNEQIERPDPKLLIVNEHSSIEFEPDFLMEDKDEFSLERNKEKLRKTEESEPEEIEVESQEEEATTSTENEADLFVPVQEQVKDHPPTEIPVVSAEELLNQQAEKDLEESISKLHRVIRPPVQPRNYAASDLTKQTQFNINEEEEEIVLDNRGADAPAKNNKPSLWSSIKKLFTKN